jgi:serine/threonine protein kinase
MLFPRPASEPITVGPYTLSELIGQGGMAVVYKAKRQGPAGFEKNVVVKAMLPGLIDRKELVDLFRAEAKLSAQLNHPNIVQVNDFGVADDVPYLVMEFLNGRNLTQLRGALEASSGGAPGKLPIGAALAIARDMCHALGYAHDFVDSEGKRRQIIHRDVSPSNVMLCRDGMVKLLDFGVAKVAGQFEAEVTQSFRGKYAYMAPEQVNRQAIDRRVDVFAAGIVLHEMLTGKRLFAASNELETLERVAHARVVAPSVDNPEVPRKLDALVKKALSRDPAQRFSSGREMAEALEELNAKAWSRRKLASWLTQLFPEAFTVTCEVCGKQVVPADECAECGTFAPSQETDVAPISMPSIPAIDSQPLPLPPPPDSGKVARLQVVRTPVDFDRPSTLESFCTFAPNTDVRSFDGEPAQEVDVIAEAPALPVSNDTDATELPPLAPANTEPRALTPSDFIESASPPVSAARLFVVPPAKRVDDDSVKMGRVAPPSPTVKTPPVAAPSSVPTVKTPQITAAASVPTVKTPQVTAPSTVESLMAGGFDERPDSVTTRRRRAVTRPSMYIQPPPDLRTKTSGWKVLFALLVGGGVAALSAMVFVARPPVVRSPLLVSSPPATEAPAAAPAVVAPTTPAVAPIEPKPVVSSIEPKPVVSPIESKPVVSPSESKPEVSPLPPKPAAPVAASHVSRAAAPERTIAKTVEKTVEKPRPAPATRPHRAARHVSAPRTEQPKGTVKEGRIVDPFAGMD